MKLSPQWLREFVDLEVDNRQLAEALTSAGIAVEGTSGEGENTVFEMEITTNRPDAMNHYGVAREASAVYDLPLRTMSATLPPTEGASDSDGPSEGPQANGPAPTASVNGPGGFQIDIEDHEGCARYTARMMHEVKIGPSPELIAKRLTLVDQRPINNAADASNYTLWEMGHPTHAFDLDLLQGGKIIVRRARAGETLKTLDGVDRKLFPLDLIIADADRPIALAGVMGGFDTMITEKTRNILIESAWFDPAVVRKTAKRHGLHTDASHRFERGADYGATALACARVAWRILESGGGQPDNNVMDAVARKIDLAPVAMHIHEISRILGPGLEVHKILRILTMLGFAFVPEPGDGLEFTVHVPSWRLDVEREIDLIEEIARLHGYNKFPNTLPAYAGAVTVSPRTVKDEKLRYTLLALGYNEAVSLSFISKQDAARFCTAPAMELANPLSDEASVMRTSMVPGMLEMVAYNLNRGVNDVRLFEIGAVYQESGKSPIEPKRICLAATGNAGPPNVHQPARAITFFDVKGDIEQLLHVFQHASLYFDANVPDYFHPGRSVRAVMDGATVGYLGQVHAEVAASRKLRQDVFLAEIYLDRLYRHGLRDIRYQPLPKYPAVERDFSFIFDDALLFEKVRESVKALKIPELRNFVPAEIFRGGQVPPGKYSILLRATLQSTQRTLREDEVAQWSGQIIKTLQGLGGRLRA